MANNKTLSERIVDSAGTGKSDPTELSILDDLTATATELNKLSGAGAVVASGTAVANITDAVAITGGESPTEAEHNALVTKINSIIAALEAFRIAASS